MNRLLKNPLLYLLILIILVWAVAVAIGGASGARKIEYGEFIQDLKDRNVKSVSAGRNSGKLEGEFKDGTKFRSEYGDLKELQEEVKAVDVGILKINAENPSLWGSLLTSVLPFVIILAIFFFLMQQMQGGGNRVMSFGKAKAKVVSKEQPKITFDDVAGV
ncbi:MAG: ATP-dependent metallopeptidase FtsH/Yme1/Tma family protein, partial [Actinomycetota bacterium]